MTQTMNQTRKTSRVTEWQDKAIHAKSTTFELRGKSIGIISPDKKFIEECWNVLSEHFECGQKCDIKRLQDVVMFESDMVETK